jgi:hypothetical protein
MPIETLSLGILNEEGIGKGVCGPGASDVELCCVYPDQGCDTLEVRDHKQSRAGLLSALEGRILRAAFGKACRDHLWRMGLKTSMKLMLHWPGRRVFSLASAARC